MTIWLETIDQKRLACREILSCEITAALDAACEAPLKDYFARRQAADAGKNGNGRMARNVVERAILNQSKRLVADPDASLELLLPGDFDLDED